MLKELRFAISYASEWQSCCTTIWICHRIASCCRSCSKKAAFWVGILDSLRILLSAACIHSLWLPFVFKPSWEQHVHGMQIISWPILHSTINLSSFSSLLLQIWSILAFSLFCASDLNDCTSSVKVSIPNTTTRFRGQRFFYHVSFPSFLSPLLTLHCFLIPFLHFFLRTWYLKFINGTGRFMCNLFNRFIKAQLGWNSLPCFPCFQNLLGFLIEVFQNILGWFEYMWFVSHYQKLWVWDYQLLNTYLDLSEWFISSSVYVTFWWPPKSNWSVTCCTFYLYFSP